MPKKTTKKPEEKPLTTQEPKASPPQERIDLGLRLAALRDAKKLTQEEVAEKMEVKGRGTVWAWEHGGGAPDAFMLGKLAEFYGVSADYLLWGEKLPGGAALMAAFSKMDATERAMILRTAGVSSVAQDEQALLKNTGEHAPKKPAEGNGKKSENH